jgi:hypothetical protein
MEDIFEEMHYEFINSEEYWVFLRKLDEDEI